MTYKVYVSDQPPEEVLESMDKELTGAGWIDLSMSCFTSGVTWFVYRKGKESITLVSTQPVGPFNTPRLRDDLVEKGETVITIRTNTTFYDRLLDKVHRDASAQDLVR